MEHLSNKNKNWFYKKYRDFLKDRFWTFNNALSIMLQRGGSVIVEAGCVREKDDWAGGMSTFIFADVAKHYRLNFHSVDINKENICTAMKICEEYLDSVTFHHANSREFLEHLNMKIDLLYLDSMDTSKTDLVKAKRSQKHQLNEIKTAYGNLKETSVVLLDDNDAKTGGKTAMSKEFLKENGWINIFDHRQALFIKDLEG